MNILEVKGIDVFCDGIQLLQNVSFNLGIGEKCLIIGKNGSGKTSLINSIGGNKRFVIQSGDIIYDVGLLRESIVDWSADQYLKSGIFMSFQNPVEIEGLTLFNLLKASFESICNYQGIKMLNEEDFKRLVLEKIHALKMDKSVLDKDFNFKMSGGEKKMNELLQLLLFKPRLALLDEVDSGLDVDKLNLLSQSMDSDCSFIIVTHNTKIAKYIDIDRVHILNNKTIVKSGNKELIELIDKYGYDFVV